MCKCIHVAHLPKTQCLMTLRIPEGYQLVKAIDPTPDPSLAFTIPHPPKDT